MPVARADEFGQGVLDEASRLWLSRLRQGAPDREVAVGELHRLLLRAARYEVGRRRGSAPHMGVAERDDIAQQSADDAVVAVLGKLDSFRGQSRFTTWAYKFALLEAGVRMRRRAWQGREIPTAPEDWSLIADPGARPHAEAERSELVRAVTRAIGEALTPHQREVLVAITLQDVPIDVLAERLNTTRGALYKTLHDARRKLRAQLVGEGHDLQFEEDER